MRNSNPDMLVYIAMGDAYAVAVEYNNTLHDACLLFQKYYSHPTHKNVPGTYTDDTEMSVANTKVLLQYDEPFRPLMFADAYVHEFRRGGCRNGYSRGFQGVLERMHSGNELLLTIRPDSTKNGAAMRAVPFGVLPTVERVQHAATMQARITHNTLQGLFSARAVALMSHAALYEDVSLSSLGDYCKQHLPKNDVRCFGYVFDEPWPGTPVRSYTGASVAITTVHAVVDVLTRENSLMGIMRRIIAWGGDTDSVAAIAWGIASAWYREEKLPPFMERDLEGGNSKTGAVYLRLLGEKLMYKYR